VITHNNKDPLVSRGKVKAPHTMYAGTRNPRTVVRKGKKILFVLRSTCCFSVYYISRRREVVQHFSMAPSLTQVQWRQTVKETVGFKESSISSAALGGKRTHLEDVVFKSCFVPNVSIGTCAKRYCIVTRLFMF
jgi:hypothetical protein